MSNKKVITALLRNDLSLFIQRTFNTVSPAEKYQPNWHVDAIAHHLTQVMEGEIKRLVITVPPRHLKSVSASVAYVAWLLGQDPSARIICASYSPQLAEKFSEDTRLVMEQSWYKEVFPATVISPVKDTKGEFGTTQQGFRLATSVGGALTGRGGTYIIIDDPHKADDAYSETKRAQVIAWFQQTVLSRLDDPETGRIIIIQQRFHEGDLAGTVLEDGGWTHLNLPAIAETPQKIQIGPGEYCHRKIGDVLHPERMSKQLLDQMRTQMGSYAFAGQYQQEPAPAGGGIVKFSWFPRYQGEYTPTFDDRIIQSWDLAYTITELASYTVCTTWLYRNHRLYLLDVLRKRMETPALLRVIPEHREKWGAETVVLEQTGVGGSVWQQLRQLDDPNFTRYLRYAPKEDKATRLMKVAHYIESGRVLLPEQAPWLDEFRKEILQFPNGKYDDQVDSLTQALLWIWYQTFPPPRGMFKGPADDGSTGGGGPQSTVTVISDPPDLSIDDLFSMKIF